MRQNIKFSRGTFIVFMFYTSIKYKLTGITVKFRNVLQMHFKLFLFMFHHHLSKMFQVFCMNPNPREFWSQTLIYPSVYLCNPMLQTLDISNYEFCSIKQIKFWISKVYTFKLQDIWSLWQDSVFFLNFFLLFEI